MRTLKVFADLGQTGEGHYTFFAPRDEVFNEGTTLLPKWLRYDLDSLDGSNQKSEEIEKIFKMHTRKCQK